MDVGVELDWNTFSRSAVTCTSPAPLSLFAEDGQTETHGTRTVSSAELDAALQAAIRARNMTAPQSAGRALCVFCEGGCGGKWPEGMSSILFTGYNPATGSKFAVARWSGYANRCKDPRHVSSFNGLHPFLCCQSR